MPRTVSSAHRRAFIWAIVLGFGILALLGGTYWGWAAPRCGSCHDDVEFVAATQDSSHVATDCTSCHAGSAPVDRVEMGLHQALRWVPVWAGRAREAAAVPDARCIACHESVLTGVVASQGIRIEHANCAAGTACTECHSAVAHGDAISWARVYDMETCLECHVSQGLDDCDLCHAGNLPSVRVSSGVFAITHGVNWERTHGMGNSATCAACHTAASCENCHGVGLPHGPGFLDVHSDLAQDTGARCSDCHEERFCNECHGLAMPHPREFTLGHATPAQEDEELCRHCHLESDCSTCHETHVHPGGAIGTLSGQRVGR